MAVFVLEDLEASIEVTLFPRTLVEHGHKLDDDVIVAVQGRLDRRDESRINLICQSIEVLSGPASRSPRRRCALRIPATSLDELSIQRLKRILRDHPGDSVVMLDLGTQVLRLSDEFRVDVDRVVGELRMAFGHDAVVLLTPIRSECSLHAVETMRRTCSCTSLHLASDAVRATCRMCVQHVFEPEEGTWQFRCKRTIRRPSPTPTSTNWRRWVERSASGSCRRPRRTGSSSPSPASTASCTGSRSPRSSASAARRACCSG